jgi:hypothetical protein
VLIHGCWPVVTRYCMSGQANAAAESCKCCGQQAVQTLKHGRKAELLSSIMQEGNYFTDAAHMRSKTHQCYEPQQMILLVA